MVATKAAWSPAAEIGCVERTQPVSQAMAATRARFIGSTRIKAVRRTASCPRDQAIPGAVYSRRACEIVHRSGGSAKHPLRAGPRRDCWHRLILHCRRRGCTGRLSPRATSSAGARHPLFRSAGRRRMTDYRAWLGTGHDAWAGWCIVESPSSVPTGYQNAVGLWICGVYGMFEIKNEVDLANTVRFSVYDCGLFARILRSGPESVGPGDAHADDDRMGRRCSPNGSDPSRRGRESDTARSARRVGDGSVDSIPNSPALDLA